MTTTLKDLDLNNCFNLEEGLTPRLTVQSEATELLHAAAAMYAPCKLSFTSRSALLLCCLCCCRLVG
jgi:hypothetical protein